MSHLLPKKIKDCGVHVQGTNHKSKAFLLADPGHLPHVSGKGEGKLAYAVGLATGFVQTKFFHHGFEWWMGRT